MRVSAKLFVTIGPEKANELYGAVKKAIDKWQRALLDKCLLENGYENRFHFLSATNSNGLKENRRDWSNGIWKCDTHDFGSFNMHFRVKGESRSLFCTHTCSSDYSDVSIGPKVIFSLGCWGMSDEIMKIIANVGKQYGDCFYDFNDCDDQDFVQL